MHTQCPHCQTLYRVHTEQLRAAAGQVRCSRCDNIFDAIRDLHDSDGSSTGAIDDGISLARLFDDPQPAPAGLPTTGGGASPLQLQSDPAALSEIDRLLDSLPTAETATDSHSRPGQYTDDQPPDALSAHTPAHAAQPASPTDHTTTRQRPADPAEDPHHSTGTDTPPPRQPEHDPLQLRPEQILGSPSTVVKRKHTLRWSMISLVLLLVALAQAAWWGREQLLAQPQARAVLEQLCRVAHCQLPELRAPEQFTVIERSLVSHPSAPDALQLRLQFANQARFSQPYPKLLLILYNSRQQTVARRLFRPDEYLAETATDRPLIAAGQRITIEMALADPGEDVTGFKFEFF